MVIAAAALLAGLADLFLVLNSDHVADRAWAVFGPVVGWSFVGTGHYARRRRPESRFGALMIILGFTWFLAPLSEADAPLLFTLGIPLGSLWGAVLAHVLRSRSASGSAASACRTARRRPPWSTPRSRSSGSASTSCASWPAASIPAVLTEHGLEPALRSLAARSPVPVELVGATGGRLPAAVETAAYFVVSEGLTNVAKYARAEHATVRMLRVDGRLVLEVSDDGIGGAAPGTGSGLSGLADRVAALDGVLHVASPAGGGTCLRAELPCT